MDPASAAHLCVVQRLPEAPYVLPVLAHAVQVATFVRIAHVNADIHVDRNVEGLRPNYTATERPYAHKAWNQQGHGESAMQRGHCVNDDKSVLGPFWPCPGCSNKNTPTCLRIWNRLESEALRPHPGAPRTNE